jgi:hypothetical protein
METRASPSLCRFPTAAQPQASMRQSRAEKEKRDPPQQRARVKRAQSHESRAIDPFGNRLIENYLVLYLSL